MLILLFIFVILPNTQDQRMEINSSISTISRWTYEYLVKWGIPNHIATYVNLFVLLFTTIVLIYFCHTLVKRVLRTAFIRVRRKTRIVFFQYLLENRVSHYLALTVSTIVLRLAVPVVFADFKAFIKPIHTLTDIYFILVMMWVIMAVIVSAGDALRTRSSFKHKPVDSYLQVIRIILYVFAAVVIFSNLTGKSPIAFFTAMGALSAILLLMFKDTIMGFVASIQVTSNDMLRIGDWITFQKYGADGAVTEINLTTVKVQNFDKTITTVPTYAFISDAFQNWRGMQESGGRRIKRAIHIKQSTIRFLSPEEVSKFRKIQSLTSYIDHRQKDIAKNNDRIGADKTLLINGRNLTNAGLFRKYVDSYISGHSGTHKHMTMMVRQLAPTANGLPLEIYAFTSTTKWAEYEHIMADMFDHLLASAPYFDLQIYEMEGSGDTKKLQLMKEQEPY
jgi:miniconductance mechanosensitive channel